MNTIVNSPSGVVAIDDNSVVSKMKTTLKVKLLINFKNPKEFRMKPSNVNDSVFQKVSQNE